MPRLMVADVPVSHGQIEFRWVPTETILSPDSASVTGTAFDKTPTLRVFNGADATANRVVASWRVLGRPLKDVLKASRPLAPFSPTVDATDLPFLKEIDVLAEPA